MTDNTTAKIRELNDQFRKQGHYHLTTGIRGLGVAEQWEIATRVSRFDSFTPDNDPYGEHDFGAFDFKGKKVFWKIDYYDNTLTGGSENPACADTTTRVLTVMLANEY